MSAPADQRLLPWVRAGFDRRSVAAAGTVLGIYLAVWAAFPHLIDLERGRWDGLLAFIWITMSGLLLWRVDPSRDAKLALVGLGGGLVIEWWGTNTGLWTYFTDERPPLWILPAWPIAAVSIDRMTTLFERVLPALPRTARAYWVVVPAFVLAMTRFLWPSIAEPASWVVIGIMIAVTAVSPRPERDMPLFLVGAFWGIFLEGWGTSRRCWTYYTLEVPPVEAVLAHGFASIAFARGVQLLDGVYRPLTQARAQGG